MFLIFIKDQRSYRPTTRNDVDGGVQSSRLCVDRWDIPKPRYLKGWTTSSLQNFPVTSEISGVQDLFVKNNSWTNRKKDSQFSLAGIDGDIDGDLESFNRPPKMIPNKHHNFYPMAAFALKLFCRVPSLLYLQHSPVL